MTMNLGNIKTQIRSTVAQTKKKLAPIMQHHVLIALLIVAGMLMFTVITVDQILNTPSDQGYLAERSKDTIQTRFDDGTIERIEQLRNRQQGTNLKLPGGRVSPFIE
jgi:hypothetical protein